MAQVTFRYDEVLQRWAPTTYILPPLFERNNSILFGKYIETDRWEYTPADESAPTSNPALFTWMAISPDKTQVAIRGRMYTEGRESLTLQISNDPDGTVGDGSDFYWTPMPSNLFYGDYFNGSFFVDKKLAGVGTGKLSFFVPYTYSEPVPTQSGNLRFNIVRYEQ